MKPPPFDDFDDDARPATKQTLCQVYTMPLRLGAITIVGLLSALFGDGVWDLISWLALGTLLALIAYHVQE